MEHDIVIAGAGLAGLAAAASAARAGARVLVLDEKSPGGRARTEERDGFRFNRGPHALYLGGPGRKVLDRLGVRPATHVPPLRGARVLADGQLHPVLSRRVLGLRAAGQLTAVFAQIARSNTYIARTNEADSPVPSTRDWIASLDLTPKAAAILEFGARVATYASDLDALPADVVLGQFRASARFVGYLDEGWQFLVDGLARAATNAGAELRPHTPVTGIEGEPGAWRVRTLRGDEIDAAAVVVATGTPAGTRRLLPEGTAPRGADQDRAGPGSASRDGAGRARANPRSAGPGSASRGDAGSGSAGQDSTDGGADRDRADGDRADRDRASQDRASRGRTGQDDASPGSAGQNRAGWDGLGPEVSAACLDLGVRHTRTRVTFGIDEPLYASPHSPRGNLAPTGMGMVHVMRYGTTTPDADRSRLEEFAAAAGIAPGDIVTSRFLPDMTAVTAMPALGTGLAGRPPVAVSGTAGLFVAGDWVGPVGWLADASLSSGERAGLLAAEAVTRTETRSPASVSPS